MHYLREILDIRVFKTIFEIESLSLYTRKSQEKIFGVRVPKTFSQGRSRNRGRKSRLYSSLILNVPVCDSDGRKKYTHYLIQKIKEQF
jgi:hypothetical protein